MRVLTRVHPSLAFCSKYDAGLQLSTRFLGESGSLTRLDGTGFRHSRSDTLRRSTSSADVVGAGPEVIAPQVFLHLNLMFLAQHVRRHFLEQVD